MKKFLLRAVVFAAIFSAVYAITDLFVNVNGFDLSIRGWGWAIMGAAFVGGIVTLNFVGSFTAGLLGDSAVSNPLFRVLWRALSYCCFAGVTVTVAKFAPDFVHVTNPVALYALFGAMGFGFGVADIAEEKLGLADSKFN